MAPSSRHTLPLLATLLLALAGCAGTPFGQQLAAGFDSPAPPAAATPPASGANRPVAVTGNAVSPAGSNPAAPAAGATATIPATAAPATAPGTQAPSPPTPAAPARPTSGSSAVNRPAWSQAPAAAVPYRITLKLPGADPSAPAEAVTKVLRAAGLRFEVETIERIPTPEAAVAAPKSTPAPPPR